MVTEALVIGARIDSSLV